MSCFFRVFFFLVGGDGGVKRGFSWGTLALDRGLIRGENSAGGAGTGLTSRLGDVEQPMRRRNFGKISGIGRWGNRRRSKQGEFRDQ